MSIVYWWGSGCLLSIGGEVDVYCLLVGKWMSIVYWWGSGCLLSIGGEVDVYCLLVGSGCLLSIGGKWMSIVYWWEVDVYCLLVGKWMSIVYPCDAPVSGVVRVFQRVGVA